MSAFDRGRSALKGWLTAGAIALALGMVLQPPGLLAQAGTVGQWSTLPFLMPINPIHLALTRDGKVLVVAGSGNDADETEFRAVVWNAPNDSFVSYTFNWDMFCNGMSVLPDGRVFINGGNLQYDPFFGERRNAVYDPVTGTFTDIEDMANGRWYPTVTTLGDGRVMTFSGLNATGGTNTTVEIYAPSLPSAQRWSAPVAATWTPPLYPRMHLNTDGRVFYAGSGRGSRFFNPTTMTWTAVIATTKFGSSRTYGTSVLLPLTPASNYRPKVMILGGSSPSTATTEIIDLGAANPQWQFGPSMSQPRIQLNATILPSGRVLVVGGSTWDEDPDTKSLNADLYNPATNTFSSAGANAFPRLYHSGSLLLPDATVMLVGGNPTRGSYQQQIEIYSPAYLFNANGTPATRPTIDSVTPGAVAYGQVFQVATPNAASIASAVLVRPGAQTHAFDMEQRLVGLNFTVGTGVLNVTAPPNGNIAPPGYYMLFLLNAAGVPSVARFVHVSTSPPPPPDGVPPTVSMTAPANNATVSGNVTVSANASDNIGVLGVQFLLGGQPLGAEDTTAPYSITWNSASVVNGPYQLSARARDTVNQTTSTAVNVTVNNAGPGGLVAAYGFNDGTGTSLADQTGTGHTGTVSGATWTAQGKFGSALTFDGVNDWVTVNDANDLDFTTGMTLEAWVFPTTSGGGSWRNVIIKERSAGEIYNLYSNADTNAPVVYLVRAAQPGQPLDARGVASLPLNTWSHLAATYDGTTLRLYVNGGQVGTRAVANPLVTSADVLRFGGNSKWGEFFAGRIDEVRLYNRALTQTEIQTDMNTPVGTPPNDTTPPLRSNGQPTGTLSAGTTQTTLSLTTNESATCRYSTTAGIAYASMPNTFSTTGGAGHSTTVSGLANGGSYTYYVRCQDGSSNANTDDFNIAFSVASDTTPPVRSNGQPTGTLAAGTTQTTISLTTNESATCRYSTTAGVAYASMPNAFSTTGGTSHSTTVSGLTNGGSYTYYVRCVDGASNANPDDFSIAFSVANPPPPDGVPPTVSMTAPANNATVSGNVTVSANAADNVGVVGVQFLLGGAPLGTEDTTAPYSITWNSTSVANGGPYLLSARARDTINQTTSTAVSVTVNNTATPPGLVASYSFNEGTGTTLVDRTGTGHTGTITGATWTTQGKFGSALTFDGVNDWVTVNDANDLDFTTGMTLEAWVFPTTSGGGSWRNVLIKERSGGEVFNLYANADTNAPVVYVVSASQPATPLDARGVASLPLNTWAHLAVSYDGTTLRLYVGGNLVGSRAVSSPLLTSTGVLRFGGNNVWGEFFAGRIDEVRLYNRALTQTEIQTDMNAAIQP